VFSFIVIGTVGANFREEGQGALLAARFQPLFKAPRRLTLVTGRELHGFTDRLANHSSSSVTGTPRAFASRLATPTVGSYLPASRLAPRRLVILGAATEPECLK